MLADLAALPRVGARRVQAKLRARTQPSIRTLPRQQPRPRCRRNHRRIIGRQRHRRECDLQPSPRTLFRKAPPQLRIGRNPSRDQHAPSPHPACRRKRLLQQPPHHRRLKARRQVENLHRQQPLLSQRGDRLCRGTCRIGNAQTTLRRCRQHPVRLQIAKNGRLDPGEREVPVQRRRIRRPAMPNCRKAKWYRRRISQLRQRIDPRPSGVRQTHQLRHLVIRLARCIIHRPAQRLIPENPSRSVAAIQVRVPARNHQRHHGRIGLNVLQQPALMSHQHRVNVALEVVHCDQRFLERKRQRLRVRDPHQQRSRQSRTLRHGNCIERLERQPRHLDRRLCHRLANHRNNVSQMLPARQLRHHATVKRM